MGTFYVGILGEILKLFDEIECRRFSSAECAVLAKSRFAVLMQQHLPETREKVESYQARRSAEQRKLNEEAAAYEVKRQAAIRGEQLRLEQEAKERNAQHYAAAAEAERREQAVWAANREQYEKERLRKLDEDQQFSEAAAKKGAALLDAIEKAGA